MSEFLKTPVPVKKSYHHLSFFHNLISYHRSMAFDRPQWVKWCAKRDQLRDLEARAGELDEEARRIEFVQVCPLGFKHNTTNHCKRCGRRVLKNIEMWLTDVTEPATKISSLLHMDHCLKYCREQLTLNASQRLKLEKVIHVLELSLFGQCAGYLQRKYAIHRGYVNAKIREAKVERSIEEYKDRQFEFMAADVRNGLNDTALLYVKYADIGDKLEADLELNFGIGCGACSASCC